MRDLTTSERAIVDLLGECFNRHQKLEEIHRSDCAEFAAAIHRAQNIVLARPATEAIQKEFGKL